MCKSSTVVSLAAKKPVFGGVHAHTVGHGRHFGLIRYALWVLS